MFLRNHDELTLEMVTDVERDYLWSTYANDPRARINVGIRRRLAPLMDNDRRKIELMNSMLLSFPGTPIIYYGDEIGMGDNIYLGDRNGVRTPMQWTPDRNGGFSRADPARLYAPLIMDPVYGYESVNVEAQSRSLSSLLNATKRLISVRKSTLVFGRGTMEFIRPTNRSVLAYVRQLGDEAVLCVANLSRSAQATELDLSAFKDRVPIEMLGRTRFPAIGTLPYLVTLSPYGFYWFQLEKPDPAKHVLPAEAQEFETLVVPLGATWMTLGRTRGIFERDVLPVYLSRARWFPQRDHKAIQTRLTSASPLAPEGENRPWFAFFEATEHGGPVVRYIMPLQVQWTRFDRDQYDPRALAAVRQGAREGRLVDVASEPAFITTLLDNIRTSYVSEELGLRVEFLPTVKLMELAAKPLQHIRAVETEQSNSTALVDSDYVVKIYRKLEAGLNPEVEVGRFLTEIAGFAHTPALLGSIELVEGKQRTALAIVHAFLENQGDAWTVTAAYLDRFVDEQRLLANADEVGEQNEQVPYLRYMTQTGRRVAQMHVALASRDDIEDFAPTPTTAEDVKTWIDDIIVRADRAFDGLTKAKSSMKEPDRVVTDALLAYRGNLRQRLEAMLPADFAGMNIRHHGDFHLGQMLIVMDDIYIIDFEGEPRRPIAERRRKAPAARDVAGLLRSIDYSATAALQRALKAAPDDHAKLAPALESWRDRAAATFLAAYRETMSDARLWPSDRAMADAVLNFFLLEKAFYEIEYELAHRPDWLRVPVAGTLRILSPQS